MPNVTASEELEQAVAQLSRSDKGQQAMRDLLAFLENGGISLDAINQRQILGLLSGAWGSHAGTALELLRDAVSPEEESASVEVANS